jgi:RNA polymerase sigma-B factor
VATTTTTHIPEAQTGGLSLDSGADIDADTAAEESLRRLSQLAHDDPAWTLCRDEVITAYQPLARRAAIKFQRRGEEVDDLVQVAMIGLIKAVDRFDPERGVHFVHYALPTMLGELKRHFRDRAWTVRVNRGLQETHLRIVRAVPELCQALQRTPTTADIAEHLGIKEDEVIEGTRCAGAYTARSLNDTVVGSEDIQLVDMMGDADAMLELVPDRVALHEVVQRLPEREREILKLRFMDNLTQAEIATLIGVSQMHVSRLLTKAFAQLKEMLLED